MGEKLTLACRDVGMDCNFVVKGKKEAKVMAKASKHLAKKHQLTSLTPDMVAKAKAAIKRTP